MRGLWQRKATRRNIEKAKWLEEYGVNAMWAEIVFLAVKPNKVANVLGGIRDALRGRILVSLAAGVPNKDPKGARPGAKVVRAMPNIAILVGEAFIGHTTTDLEPDEREGQIPSQGLWRVSSRRWGAHGRNKRAQRLETCLSFGLR
ncbi:Pyrroline-5-carboxylate reductase [Thermococcus sp. 2319x1]|uniref:pyrroline-5-carboxylate reductase family protein n=1 Tax=Thermococcus sp. 2319x1 TaxID=1674923 RepID=UPI00073A8557|nr:Pyrroline-5-carboxylate reductase [Thermococcus sp. 2319x1]